MLKEDATSVMTTINKKKHKKQTKGIDRTTPEVQSSQLHLVDEAAQLFESKCQSLSHFCCLMNVFSFLLPVEIGRSYYSFRRSSSYPRNLPDLFETTVSSSRSRSLGWVSNVEKKRVSLRRSFVTMWVAFVSCS